MAYMRGENHIWSDGHCVQFWIADGEDYWKESGWAEDCDGKDIPRGVQLKKLVEAIEALGPAVLSSHSGT